MRPGSQRKMSMVMQVHERTLQGDFLMALLKEILAKRRSMGNPLKVLPTSLILWYDTYSMPFLCIL